MAEPRSGIQNPPGADTPIAGAVQVSEDDHLCFREESPGKLLAAAAAGKPAPDNADGALRRPETVHESAEKRIADTLPPEDGRGKLAHGP